MSRLAKRPIAISKGAEVSVSGSTLTVKGPKGTLTKEIHPDIAIVVGQDGVQVSVKKENLETKALVGTFASHVRNMLEGVTKGFVKKLAIEGVGFRWEVAGQAINLALGFSHPVKVEIPQGIKATIDKTGLTLEGFDKEVVGQFAAEIRALKKPEPYKGKGIRYDTEVIRRKQGKKVA